MRELVWQAPPITERAMEMVLDALEGEDVSEARVPAVRLENVLKVTPMFRESLRELKTGIQGIPVRDFVNEPAPREFAAPGLAVRFVTEPLGEDEASSRDPVDDTSSTTTASATTASTTAQTAALTTALAAGDLDGDGRQDIVRLRGDGDIEIRTAAENHRVAETHSLGEGLDRLLLLDLDNDTDLDLLAYGAERAAVLLGAGASAGVEDVGGEEGGLFRRAEDDLGLAAAGARAIEAIDFDIEGDLDLAAVGGAAGPVDLWRNGLDGPLERVGTKVFPRLPASRPEAITASDLDRDGDLDLLVGHARGVQWLDNLRQGRFVDRSLAAGLVPTGEPTQAVRAVAAIDLDADGLPEIVAAGEGVRVWRNRGGFFEPWNLAGLPDGEFHSIVALDADLDGRRDLALAGPAGVRVLARDAAGFRELPVEGASSSPDFEVTSLVAADLDADGDIDLVAGGAGGLSRLENRLEESGAERHWLALRLRGLDKGSSKNNVYGVGSVIEVRAGDAYQFLEAEGDVVHVGLGEHETARTVRVVWTNGVPQNRIDLEGDRVIVEEQLLKGSCPFLYAWDGDGFAFVTDLLWGAPIGLPAAPGAWVPSDPSELVRVDGAALDDDGFYRLRITEELWEAAFFDRVRLWVVDHPADVEVASALKILPDGPTPEAVLASRDLRPVVQALDGQGRDVTERVRARDEVYADGYEPSRYQGVAKPWTFTFDLGLGDGFDDAPDGIRLHLDGWIFPADASLNLAVAQRDDYPWLPPRLEVEIDGEDGENRWRTLVESTGFPAGKTKTMIVDLPPLPANATGRLRLVTSLWLHWDRVAWTTRRVDDVPVVRAKLDPARADLRYRGFSAPVRRAPNAPHGFDYASVSRPSAADRAPWLPFPGRYTRYGDVAPLLAEVEDFSVILAAGDELAVDFDASELAPPPAGWRRTVFLESHGWDKDADRNTGEGTRLEPLPFHAMTSYPYAAGESWPDTPGHRRYVDEWLTREVPPEDPRNE